MKWGDENKRPIIRTLQSLLRTYHPLRVGLKGSSPTLPWRLCTKRGNGCPNHAARPSYLSKKRVTILEANDVFTVGYPIYGPSHADDAA